MSTKKPYKAIAEKLVESGIRPTSQRLNIARLMFGEGLDAHRHFTADHLYDEAKSAGLKLSLATIYNNLNVFKEAGLLKEVILHTGQSYFDTNIDDHHHFFDEDAGEVIDIDSESLKLLDLPPLPAGKKVKSVQVIIRLEDDCESNGVN